MKIKSFSELTERVWKTIEKPLIAIYQLERYEVSQPGYQVKVFDGDQDTGICMNAYCLDEIHEDIQYNADWLQYYERGEGDEPELVGIYA